MDVPKYPSFLIPEDVMRLTGFSYSHSCRIIKKMNDELKEKGFYTMRGRISTKFYCDKTGIDPETILVSLENPKERKEKAG